MKILVIYHYSGSRKLGRAYRPFYLGREWVRSGHDVTIVAASYSHVRTIQPQVSRNLDTTEEEGVRYRWVRTNSYMGNGAGRVANMLSFVGNLLASARRIAREERPDVVICSSTYPLDIYPGAWIAKRAGARLIFEVHDLWPLTPMLLGGYSRKHPYVQLLSRAESKAYHDADLVVSILPAAKDYMVSRGMAESKFAYIPNGVDLSDPPDSPDGRAEKLLSLVSREKHSGRFLVAHTGGVGLSNNLATLVEAADSLREENIAFFIVGDGPQREALQTQVMSRGMRNVHFNPLVPKGSLMQILNAMDGLYLGFQRSSLYQYGISPNKVFDYMLAGRPVILAAQAANDPVREARCGITVSPDNPQEVANAIMKLRDMSPDERTRLGENGRSYVMQNHDYRILARNFVEQITRLNSRSVAPGLYPTVSVTEHQKC